jgi:tetratricopeptide (TPR) repeat protein
MRPGVLAWVLVLATVGCSQSTVARRSTADEVVKPLGSPAAPSTSRQSLEQTRTEMEAKLRQSPKDATAAVRLADALLRLARVTNNAGLVVNAERVLNAVLAADVNRYDARRMLATVLLSQHRFRDAIREGERCRQMQPHDAWPLGVLGDAHLELGEYDQAFDAFQQMITLRPDSASYARAAYARELQGDLAGAVRLMTMALEATSPNDPESLAWHHVQIAALHLAMGHVDEAEREYAHADYVFPGHPMAIEGLARVDDARGRADSAVARLEPLVKANAAPSTLAYMGQLLRKVGRGAEAERYERLAEASWRADVPEPAKLAMFMANSGVPERVDEAVRIAETESTVRDDIFTDDALAWAYFKAGRLDRAAAASARATRTGSLDHTIREHARAIEQAAQR